MYAQRFPDYNVVAYPSGIREKIVIFEGPAWDSASAEVKELISGLMKWHPSQRLTAKAASRSPWVERYREALRNHPSIEMKPSFGATDSMRQQVRGPPASMMGEGAKGAAIKRDGSLDGASTSKLRGNDVESASMSFDTHDPRFNANAAHSVLEAAGENGEVAGIAPTAHAIHGEVVSTPPSPVKPERGRGGEGYRSTRADSPRRESAKRTFSKVGQGSVTT